MTDDSRPLSEPVDAVTLDETIGFAFQVALERLTPAERVSFVLHDLFDLSSTEISESVGRTPGACRQLAVSARRNLQAELQVNGRPGIAIRNEGRLEGTIDIAVTDGLVTRIAIQVNNDNLLEEL